MSDLIDFVGPNRAVQILGVKLVGVNAENGKKLLFSLVLVAVVLLVGKITHASMSRALGNVEKERARFWIRQAVKLFLAALLVVGVASIWFDDPTRLTTAMGLVTAGLAFALQKVVTAVAGYFVILRGRTFNVGDRIVMGGVRGDVVALDFTQTTILEMGQPPPVQSAPPAVWVKSRQYTGRLVTVSNAKIFDEPVYNYTRDFPYIWEELSIPIHYTDDRARAESILLSVASRHTVELREMGAEALQEMSRRYFLSPEEMGPRVYYQLTDNWLELTVRFIARDHGARLLKDQMSREILDELERAGISIASTTFEIVAAPPLRIVTDSAGRGSTHALAETPVS